MLGIPVTPNGEALRKTFVIAGSYHEFRNWCMFSRVNPRSRNVKFVSDAWSMRGYSDFDVVHTGHYAHRRDIEAIWNELRHYRAIGAIKNDFEQYESCEIEPNITGMPNAVS